MIGFLVFLALALLGVFFLWLATPRIRMVQWGRYTATRQGLKNHPKLDDEPDVVEFVDYRYWIRFRPNPGVNLPVLGYWSKAYGRKRPRRPWE